MSAVKILFISHDASRTGAPILLLHLIKLLKENGYSISIIIKNNSGPLVGDFKILADDFFIFNPDPQKKNSRLKKLLLMKAKTMQLKKHLNVDFIISNTLTNGDILPLVRKTYKGKIISYIHELHIASKFFTSARNLKNVFSISDHYIVPSNAVKRFIEDEFNVSAAIISKLNYYIPPSLVVKHEPQTAITKNTFTIGSVGTIDWRKSPDLFLLIAKKVVQQIGNMNIRFVWKGGKKNSSEYERLMYDIKKLHLEPYIEFEDASPDTDAFFQKIDLFLLTSREDPYPLVVLEAASFGIPSICFRDAGGSPEFIEDNAGTVVDYLDLDSLAKNICNYYNDRRLLKKHGEQARKKLQCVHQNKDLILQQFKVMLNTVGKHEH